MRRLGEHRPCDEHADVVARLLVVGLRLEPPGERDLIELPGERMRPRTVGVDLGHERVELVDEADHLLLRAGGDGEDLALEQAALTRRIDVDVLAGPVARVGGQAEVGEGLLERILVGRDPLAADLEGGSVDVVRPETAADAIASLEDSDAETRLDEVGSSREARCSGADDDDVAFDVFHGVLPLAGQARGVRARGVRLVMFRWG